MSASKYIKAAFQKAISGKDPELKAGYKQRLIQWRREHTVVTLKKPTNTIRARELGYKAKQGVTVARVKVKRSSGKQKRVNKGRRHSRMGVRKLKRAKSLQVIGEERTSRKYPNLEVLNSYWVGEDGVHKLAHFSEDCRF